MSRLSKECILEGVEETEIRLGGGGFGSVFLAKWSGSNVAIKRLHESLMGLDRNNKPSKEFQRFIAEFPTLCKCAHPTIVQVFGMVPPSTHRGSHGVVMELLRVSLKERYAQQPCLSATQEIGILQNIASAANYLHSKNFLHRDITTSNVMLTNAGAESEGVLAKVVDLGIVRALGDSTQDARSWTEAPGQPSYMAPETYVSCGDRKVSYGRPSDIFAIGVTAMAMLNRREPPSFPVLCLEGRARDIAGLQKAHPLCAVVEECVLDDPEGRLSASQLCEQLAVIQSAHHSVAAESSPAADSELLPRSSKDSASYIRILETKNAELAELRRKLELADKEQARLHQYLAAERQQSRQLRNLAMRRVVQDSQKLLPVNPSSPDTGMLARCQRLFAVDGTVLAMDQIPKASHNFPVLLLSTGKKIQDFKQVSHNENSFTLFASARYFEGAKSPTFLVRLGRNFTMTTVHTSATRESIVFSHPKE